MLRLIYDNLEHFLCIVILIGRIGDIGSTWLVTPRLKLEANPIVRKLRWPFAFATLALCLVPYWNTTAALPLAVVFLLVTAQNLSGAWLARALGEDRYLDLLRTAARSSDPFAAIGLVWASSAFFVLAGLLLLVFYPHTNEDWGFWYAAGIVLFGLVGGLYRSLFLRRLFRTAVAEDE
ncbi:MAG: hypothetical protein O7B99_12425 [Planctomycetota bacterium]|nr:hypothetical protein [Planctomycetota bacterium]